MEPALEMVHLGRLMRSAVRLVKGIRLRVFDECFEMAVFSAIPWFKVCFADSTLGRYSAHLYASVCQSDPAMSCTWTG